MLLQRMDCLKCVSATMLPLIHKHYIASASHSGSCLGCWNYETYTAISSLLLLAKRLSNSMNEYMHGWMDEGRKGGRKV